MYAGRTISSSCTVGEAPVVHGGEEVAHVQDADDVVERLAVHRVARVRRVEHRRERLLRRQLDRDRDDLGPRHHHVGGVLVAEDEDLVDHLLLLVLDLALLARAREQHAQLGLRQRLALGARRLEPEQRGARRRSTVRSTQTNGAKTVKNARTGAGHPERRALRSGRARRPSARARRSRRGRT